MNENHDTQKLRDLHDNAIIAETRTRAAFADLHELLGPRAGTAHEGKTTAYTRELQTIAENTAKISQAAETIIKTTKEIEQKTK